MLSFAFSDDIPTCITRLSVSICTFIWLKQVLYRYICTANNDFSFSMPIHHNQIKELEKFFNIQYSTLYGKEDNSEKIKKLYTLGFLGSMSSAKGYFLYLLFGFLFILNIGILIPLAQYIYNLNLGDTYISLACGTEIVIFFIVIILLWKKFR